VISIAEGIVPVKAEAGGAESGESARRTVSILDGQHRVGALKILLKNKVLTKGDQVLVEVFPDVDEKRAVDLFMEINSAQPIRFVDLPGVTTPDVKWMLEGAMQRLKEAHPAMFRPSVWYGGRRRVGGGGALSYVGLYLRIHGLSHVAPLCQRSFARHTPTPTGRLPCLQTRDVSEYTASLLQLYFSLACVIRHTHSSYYAAPSTLCDTITSAPCVCVLTLTHACTPTDSPTPCRGA
jgi:hypothetical protein